MDETPYRFEPAFLEEDVPSPLVGLATEIAQCSARLPGRLPAPAAAELADLVRIMDCYYSTKISLFEQRSPGSATPGTEHTPTS